MPKDTATQHSRPVTYDHLKKKKKAVRKTIRIALDSEVADRYDEANNEFELAKMLLRSDPENRDLAARVTHAEEQYQAAREELTEASTNFVFRSIGRQAYSDLRAQHPRTPKQMEEDKAEGRDSANTPWNHDTFPQALVAACAVEPLLTPENTAEMWDDPEWSEAELAALFSTAYQANGEVRVADLGKG